MATALVCAAALALDLAVPASRGGSRVAAQATATLGAVQQGLGAIPAEVRRVVATGGGEARPELPFALLRRLSTTLPVRVDSLVLVDERGRPVAWTGDRARLPLRLRALGGRVVDSEPALASTWVWWREPVFEAGRPRGALLAGVEIPDAGAPRVLGAFAGRAAVIAPRLAGGAALEGPGGRRILGLAVQPSPALPWSTPAAAMAVVAGLLAVSGALPWGLALLGAVPAALLAGPWLSRGWLVALVLAILAWLAERLPASWAVRLPAAAAAGAAAWLLPQAASRLGLPGMPSNLLWPGVLTWALVFSLALLLRRLAPPSSGRPWFLAALAWLVLAVGLLRAGPVLLGAGTALVVLWGLPRRGRAVLAALAAAAILVGGDAAQARSTLVATTDATLSRVGGMAVPAGTLLSSLPDPALAELVQLQPTEQLVVLGRLASWVGFSGVLPGCALVLVDPGGRTSATWGEAASATETLDEIATRNLAGGWRIAVLARRPPEDVLAAMGAERFSGPVAVFNRSGAPVSRGGTFRPLSPDRVGRALAAGRSWGRVGVGERTLPAYLRSWGDAVVAVPWVVLPVPETGLLLAALALWAALPVGVWSNRGLWQDWWRQRRTFTGRLRLLLVATTVAPVVLLAYLLPLQWSRQQRGSRLELARALSEPVARSNWQDELVWRAREMGGVLSVYRGGAVVSSTRPDLVVRGVVPWMAPEQSYVRAVRGWYEPVVRGDDVASVYAPVPHAEDPTVAGIEGLRLGALAGSASPAEWFVVTGLLGLLLAVAAAERLGRRMGRPLRDLVAAARRLERGEPVPALPSSADEDLAVLTRGFAAMAATVQHREEELRRERDLLETVLGTLSAAVVVTDAEGTRVELANPAARRLMGSGAGLEGLRGAFGEPLEGLMARARAGTGAADAVRPSHAPESVWQVTVLPLAAVSDRLLMVMEDVSEVARAERLASLANLARIVAHEVKNPLTPIRLWAEELQAALGRSPEDVAAIARTAAEQILERTEHLRDVAQGFSNLVALEHWDPVPVDLAALAREVTAEYSVLDQRGIVLEVRATGSGRVMADATWLRRALRHLLENSTRALAPRGGEIEVAVSERGGEAELTVRDTGGGVPDEHLSRLFEPHFSTTSEGSGLGLAVVRGVAARVGGRVEARNTGTGLEVTMTLPLFLDEGGSG